MADDNMVTQGARASRLMLLTLFPRIVTTSRPEGQSQVTRLDEACHFMTITKTIIPVSYPLQ